MVELHRALKDPHVRTGNRDVSEHDEGKPNHPDVASSHTSDVSEMVDEINSVTYMYMVSSVVLQITHSHTTETLERLLETHPPLFHTEFADTARHIQCGVIGCRR